MYRSMIWSSGSVRSSVLCCLSRTQSAVGRPIPPDLQAGSARRVSRDDAAPPGSVRRVRGPLRAVVRVEAQLAVTQLPDDEEVPLVTLAVARPELEVRGRAAVGAGHPADALEALFDH